MTFWKTQDFKALQRAWYQRLKDEGFQDAEKLDIEKGELTLKQTAAYPYRKCPDRQAILGKEDYYRLLSQRVEQEQFSSLRDWIIMMMFAEGARYKDIHETLSRRRPPCFINRTLNRNTIRYKIRKYEMHWGLREYTPRQMNIEIEPRCKKEAS